MVAIGLAAIASVAAPVLADSSSGLEGINRAREQANEQADCGLNIAEFHLANAGELCK